MQKQIGTTEILQRPSEKAFSVIMQRLSKWVFNRYDCETSYFFFEAGSPRHSVIKSLLQKNDLVRLDGVLHFPIRYGGQTIGTVTAKENDQKMSIQQQTELNMLFSMMVEPTLKDIERLEIADQLSDHMKYAHADRLLRFRTPRTRQKPSFELTSPTPKNIRFDLPTLIECCQLEEARKLALEIHHESHRYAFVTIDQIETSMFESFEDFRELGHLTIFVPDLNALNHERKQFLLSYFKKAFRPQGSPQLIACCKDLSEVKQSADPELIDIANSLSVALIRMNRPFKEFRKVGLVHVLFDALSNKRDENWVETEISH